MGEAAASGGAPAPVLPAALAEDEVLLSDATQATTGLDSALADWDQAQEASLFIALTHNLHTQFWASTYCQEGRLVQEVTTDDPTARISCSRIWLPPLQVLCSRT